jgi:Flp pilus assembly protein TadG
MSEKRRGRAIKEERQRGQSLVEIAFGLVFLLVMLAGTVDVGRALFAKAALLDAVEEGALYGSYQPTDVVGIEKRIRDLTDSPVDFSDPEGIKVSVSYAGSACAGNLMSVSVTYDFLITTPFMGTILGGQTLPLSASSESLILAPGCD